MALAFVSESFDGAVWSSTYKHPNSLSASVKGLTQEDFEICIGLALTALESMKDSSNKLQYKEALSQEISRVLEENSREKEKLILKETLERKKVETSYSEKIQELEIQIQKLKGSLQVADHTSSKLREQLQTSGSLFESSLQEVSRQKEVQHERELERLERIYKERLDSMRVVFQEQEEKLRKQVERTLVSSEKGKQGEKEFEELVAQYVPHWGTLLNTSKSAHSTDREARVRGCGVRFELKNYSGEVPTAEVTKFERDMEQNHDCPMGVFISLKTGICNRKSDGFMCVKWSPHNQMLLYINNFYSHSLEDLFRIIDVNIDIAYMVYTTSIKYKEEGYNELHIQLQTRIEQAKIYIEKEVQRMERFQITINQQKSFLVETLIKHQTENIYSITQSLTALKGMLQILLGKDVVEEIPSGVSPNVSVDEGNLIPKKQRSRKPKEKEITKVDEASGAL